MGAYDAWSQAFNGERLNPVFNAYNAAVYSELRKYASQFLHRLANDDLILEKSLLVEAASHYDIVSGHLNSLTELFPFPEGGDLHNAEKASQAVCLLTQAKEAETHGLRLLKQLYDILYT